MCVCVCVCVRVCVCFLHNISKGNLSRNTKLEYLVVYVCVLQWMKIKALEASKLLLLLRKRNLMSVNVIQGPGFESRWGCMFFTLVVLLSALLITGTGHLVPN